MFTNFCLDTDANLWGIFTTDPAVIPPLLFYAYLPIMAVALLLGIIVHFQKTNTPAPNRAFFGLTLVFSLYLLNEILMWTAVPGGVNMFGWQTFLLYRVLLAMLIVAFIYTFLFRKSLSKYWLGAMYLLALPIVITLPTTLNMAEFDLAWCEAHSGVLVWYLYTLELLAALVVAGIAYTAYKRAKTNNARLTTILLFFAGQLFISFQSLTELYGELTREFQINLVGPVGALLFFAIIAYMIVRYQSFNIKIFGAQALVVTLWILIGSLLFVVTAPTPFVIVWVTLALSIVFGLNLIRSVRYEVEARRLLAEANQGQERFIHFLGHEIKGFLTVARNGYASIAEGDYGPVPEPLTAMAKDALSRVNTGVTVVESILKSANLKSGNVQFTFAKFDLRDAVRKRVDMAQSLLEARHLSLETEMPDTPCVIEGDEEHITNHVLRNLIENAIYYTPSGTIHLSLIHRTHSILFKVKDTGVGITDEDKEKLFTEGGQGKDSTKINVHSTGHGLFIVKNIVTAHHGRIWAESEGAGKGTTFYVELPVAQPKK